MTRYLEKNLTRGKKKPRQGWAPNSVQNIEVGNNIYADRGRKQSNVGSQRKRHSQRNIFFERSSGKK